MKSIDSHGRVTDNKKQTDNAELEVSQLPSANRNLSSFQFRPAEPPVDGTI